MQSSFVLVQKRQVSVPRSSVFGFPCFPDLLNGTRACSAGYFNAATQEMDEPCKRWL